MTNQFSNNADKIKVIFSPTEEKPYIVIYKPRNLPSAPLSGDDKFNALAQAAELFPSILNVKGRKPIEYGLLHRLDTATDGLLVIAASQECYDFISDQQRAGRFVKFYSARCQAGRGKENREQLEGFPVGEGPRANQSAKKIIATSYFRPFGLGGKEVRPVTQDSGKAALKKIGKAKLYTTEIEIKNESSDFVDVECKIVEGFRHQVRCHLAWAGLPIINDPIYNSCCKNQLDKKNADNIMFSATKIQFEYPRGDLNSYEIAFTWT